MMTKEGSTKIVTFMTSGDGVLVLGCGHISHIVKMHYFINNRLIFSRHRSDDIYIGMVTKEGSTKIVNFLTQESRGCCASVCKRVQACNHICETMKMLYFISI